MLRHIIGFVLIYSTLSSTAFANKVLTAYIEEYKLIAIGEMQKSAIPASIKLAQGILESDMGRSDMARQANNHFGIKCGKDWTGKTFYKLDDDRDTTGTLIESCFRAYDHPAASYAAHTTFLTNPSKSSRYGFLFDLEITDYVGWANGLKFAGYASDASYPKKLIKIIEDNKLFLLDMGFAPIKNDKDVATSLPTKKEKTKESSPKIEVKKDAKKESKKETKETAMKKEKHDVSTKETTVVEADVKGEKYRSSIINTIPVIYARRGDNLSTIAKRTGHDVYNLLSFNEGISSPHEALEDGTVIFVARKKKSATTDYHIVSNGETLYAISQKYGIRLENLCLKNNLKRDAMVKAGQKVSLVKQLSRKDTPKHDFLPRFDRYLDLNETK
jgi:LysM repeat protein